MIGHISLSTFQLLTVVNTYQYHIYSHAHYIFVMEIIKEGEKITSSQFVSYTWILQ